MPKHQFVEHRWGTRLTVDSPAEVTSLEGRAGAAVIRNASVSGAWIESSVPFKVAGRVFLRPLWRPGLGLEAYVVRTSGQGFAVEWAQPGTRTLSRLIRSGDLEPSPLQNELAEQRGLIPEPARCVH